MTRFINGLHDIINDYDLFLLDQFGVLHFGEKAPTTTIEALAYLNAHNKSVVIISNSSKDVAYSSARMSALGITPDLYDVLITSGEMVRQGVLKKDIAPFDTLGNACFLIGKSCDTQGFDDIGLDLVDDPAHADFVLMTNCDYKTRPLEIYTPVLEQCRARDLMMISANPDKIVVEGDQTYYGPGQVAGLYEGLGGRVHYIGKPNAPIFDYAVRQVPTIPTNRIIMIGDSMGHDIVGGSAMGFATALTQTGAHSAVFSSGKEVAIETLHQEYGVVPTVVIPRFAV